MLEVRVSHPRLYGAAAVSRFKRVFVMALTESLARNLQRIIEQDSDLSRGGGPHLQTPTTWTGRLAGSVYYTDTEVGMAADYAGTLEEGTEEWKPFFEKGANGKYDTSKLTPFGVWARDKMGWRRAKNGAFHIQDSYGNESPNPWYGMIAPKPRMLREAAIADVLENEIEIIGAVAAADAFG